MNEQNIKIQNIPIPIKDDVLPDFLVIGAIQIKSPFFDELVKVPQKNNWIVKADHGVEIKYKERERRIQTILNQIEQINEERNPKINIIVFPEYSIPNESNFFDIIKNFVNRSKIIFIGNYYNEKDRSSDTIIELPNGWASEETYISKKNTVSSFDKDVLNKIDEGKIYKFFWKPKNKNSKGYFQIFTCKDYLYFASPEGIKKYESMIDMDNPGIIIVPICSPKINPFVCQGELLVRHANLETGIKSIVSVLCNATNVIEQREDIEIIGNTQIISPIESKLRENVILPKGYEGLLLAEINPFNTIVHPTHLPKDPIIVVSNIMKYYLDNNSLLKPEYDSIQEHHGVVINPNVFSKAGLSKIYGLMKVDDYNGIKNDILNYRRQNYGVSIGVGGIYSYHDLVIQSYEHTLDQEYIQKCLNLRLFPFIRKKELYNEVNLGYCIVKKPIKYHGVILTDDLSRIHDGDISNLFKNNLFYKIIMGKKIDKEGEVLKKLIEEKICLKTKYDLSDRSLEEIKSHIPEYLIFLELAPGTDEIANIIHNFKNEFLPDLIKDERIRTIEEVIASENSFVRAHFILHIVGRLEDLNEIVLDKIFSHQKQYFKCKTQVRIPAEALLKNEYPILLEKIGLDGHEYRHIIDLISEYSEFADPDELVYPFGILMMPVKKNEQAKKIIDIANLYQNISENYFAGKEFFDRRDMLKFIYVLCEILALHFNNDIERNTKTKKLFTSTHLVRTTGIIIEEALYAICNNLMKKFELDEKKFDRIINYSVSLQKEGEGRFSYARLEIGTAQKPFTYISGIVSNDNQIEKFKKQLFNYLRREREMEKNNSQDFQNFDEIKVNDDISLTIQVYKELICYFGDNYEERKANLNFLKEFANIRNMASHHNKNPIDQRELFAIPDYIYAGLTVLINMNKKILENSCSVRPGNFG